MERRLLVAAGLSLAVLLGWEWLGPKPPKRAAPTVATPAPATPSAVQPATAASTAPASPAATVAPAALPPPASAEAETLTTISNGVFKAVVSNRGAVLSSFLLTGHFDEQKQPLELLRKLPPEFPRPLGLDLRVRAVCGS